MIHKTTEPHSKSEDTTGPSSDSKPMSLKEKAAIFAIMTLPPAIPAIPSIASAYGDYVDFCIDINKFGYSIQDGPRDPFGDKAFDFQLLEEGHENEVATARNLEK